MANDCGIIDGRFWIGEIGRDGGGGDGFAALEIASVCRTEAGGVLAGVKTGHADLKHSVLADWNTSTRGFGRFFRKKCASCLARASHDDRRDDA